MKISKSQINNTDAKGKYMFCPACHGNKFTCVIRASTADTDTPYDEVPCGNCGGRGVVPT